MNVKLKRAVMAAVTGTALFGFGSNAMADSQLDLIQALVDKGVLTEEEALPLMKSRANDEKKMKSSMPKIDTKGKLKITAADKSWSFQPIGRVMWDYVNTDEDDSGKADIDATELRRARLGFKGSIYNWGYKFEGDFAKGGTSIKDAYVSYGKKFGGMKAGVKLGQSHVPFGLNTKISSKYMSFMDRPWFADSEISPARESGVVVALADKKYRWAVSAGYTVGELSGSVASRDSDSSKFDDNGSTFTIRGSFVPFMQDKKHMLQVGAAYLNKSDDAETFGFEQRLVSHIDEKKWLSTEVTDFDGADAYTLDALGIYGPFHAMAEYVSYDMDSESGNDVEIDGYAIEAGYFITGESLKWKKGYTSGITPNSPSGAWQIAARFESTEIDDTVANGDDEADKFSIGLNYYPRQNLRLMLNYDKVTDLKVNGVDVDYEPSAVKFRAQAYW
jgi:phosphate-selective porin OprO/OprP